MFRHLRIHNWKHIEVCHIAETFTKTLTSFRECHRAGIYFDEDGSDEKSYSGKGSSYPRQRVNHSDEDDWTPQQDNWRPQRDNWRPRQNHQFSTRSPNRQFNFSRGENSFEGYRPRRFNPAFGDEMRNSPSDADAWQQSIEKYFYIEHPDVTQRSEEEVEAYRESVNISVQGSEVPKPIKSFEELCLPESLKKVVMEQGYAEPTPIQAQGWPTVLSGRNMVGISQTGSGKTLVFTLPGIIHAMNQSATKGFNRGCNPQVLILAPTRELVQQILQVNDKFSQSCGLVSATAYGGASRHAQLRQLRGAHICVATPGRLIDFVSDGQVSLQQCSYLVLDEADRMLDMGFEPQIRNIVRRIRPDRQTLMWSATWPKEIQELAEDFLTDYVQVTVGEGELFANPNIKQNIYLVDEFSKEKRFVTLLKDLTSTAEAKVLVFAQTKRKVDFLGQRLNHLQIPALCIHGDVSQNRRDQVLHMFRNTKSCVLIATDVAARGLDISDVQHVINYDFPLNIEDYIHRIGRTARGAASGEAHSFFTPENTGLAKELVSVMKQADQEIDAELLSMIPSRTTKTKGFSNFHSGGLRRRQFHY